MSSIVFPVRYVSEGLAIQTTSRDLSHMGIGIRALRPPPVGSRVSMALYLPNSTTPEVAVARVARTSAETGTFWADFVVLDAAARMRIGHILARDKVSEQNTARTFDRVSVELTVKFRTAKEFVEEHATNLSRGGVFIRCEDPPHVDETVELRFELPDGTELETNGVVVHRVPPGGPQPAGVGVQFLDAADNFREGIDKYMDRLSRS